MARLAGWLQKSWYEKEAPVGLLPIAALYRGAVRLRRLAYRKGWKATTRLPVPVIVVGNLTVGGVGKTPLAIWLAEFLAQAGYKPGIISRGYGGGRQEKPLAVVAESDPACAGDEPVLMAGRTGCPVYVFHRRVEAGKALLAECGCDIVIADDALQHYALARDVEIAVVDGERGFGNGQCLPAGPLRESVERLKEVDLIVGRGKAAEGEFLMSIRGDRAVNLANPNLARHLNEFTGMELLAVAGIGHPDRFFDELKAQGLVFEARPFPDHHPYVPEDLATKPGVEVLMTEKDAVKCRGFARDNHWYVPVKAELPPEFGEKLLQLLKVKCHGQKTA